MSDVFCDDLRVSMAPGSWADISSELGDSLGDAGFLPEYETDRVKAWRCDGGTVKSERMHGVRVLSLSGRALAALRLRKLLQGTLAVVASVPHKVTGLHATLDVRESTAPVLSRILAKAESDTGLRAGRKRIAVQAIERILKRQGDGSDTGTIYCGSRAAEIRPVVYDKRQERQYRGLPDLGYDLTRYELRTRNVGATLRDACEPAGLFWHYMAPDFLQRPEGVAGWTPEGVGYVLDRPSPALPAARLLRAVEGSADFAGLVRLAGTFPGGIDYLCALVRRADRGSGPDGVQGLPAPAETALSA